MGDAAARLTGSIGVEKSRTDAGSNPARAKQVTICQPPPTTGE